MFDCSLLSEALLEFVVVADTHFMLDAGQGAAEFSSRRRQTARAAAALRLVAGLRCPLVFHLGDLVQDYPDTATFPEAIRGAVQQLEDCGVAPYHVAGNHDVGDKPDPTMPTRPVTPESLAAYHAAFGPSWYSMNQQNCHLVVLNSQIMNSKLPEAAQQQQWLERDLEAHKGKRKFLFLHLPTYLWDENEPALGHYDNIAEPARAWLLELVRRHDVEMMLSAHVHCSFFDRIGNTRYMIANSTSFTRPGFCHMFTSAPPPDQGRDDAMKLGFYLCRVRQHHTDVHFLRTSGTHEVEDVLQRAVSPSAEAGGTTPDPAQRAPVTPQPVRQRLVTRTSATLQDSSLALSLSHPLSTTTEIPLAWPSAIRQRVRNDYPMLSCIELGAAAVRAPISDLAEPFLASRLAILRREGVSIIATVIWSDRLNVAELLGRYHAQIDGLELQLGGTPWPHAAQLEALRQCSFAKAAGTGQQCSISLSTIVPGEVLAGKQHPRTRHGFRVDEVSELDTRLATAGVRVDRVLCRLSPEPNLWDVVQQLAGLDVSDSIGCVDAQLELSGSDDSRVAAEAAEAVVAMFAVPDARLFIDPLVDFDRTMDVRHGLLDTLCNPRAAFHVLRCLNTIVTVARDSVRYGIGETSSLLDDQFRACTIRAPASTWWLLLPYEAVALSDIPEPPFEAAVSNLPLRVYHLARGLVTETTPRDWKAAVGPEISEPVLFTA